MKPLKIGIGGVRGVVGETFTPDLVVGFAQAFGSYLGRGRILLCRDTRPSGPMVAAAVTAGLLATGNEVVDLGICPTPSLQLAVPWLGALGGVSVTAGHNPAPWNALKFVRADGLYLTAPQAEELLDIYHQGRFDKAAWDSMPTRVEQAEAIGHHLEVLRGCFDVDRVRARRFRVAVDCCNGPCSLLTPRWLAELGCDVLAINDDPAAGFPHTPEPKPETAMQVRAVVKAGRADIGLVLDGDGERVSLVDETARALSEEVTLPLAADMALQERVGPVVTNVCTTMAVDLVAARYGAAVIRTPVGQPFISEAMLDNRAVIGGEGNGSVAVPRVQVTHDGAATIGLMLSHLAEKDLPVSTLVDALPTLVMVKEHVPIEPNVIYSALQDFRDAVQEEAEGQADLSDGVKVSFPDGWVHVRASNTESMLRLIVEAPNAARANELAGWAHDRLGR